MAMKALLRVFGLGKKEDEHSAKEKAQKQGPRRHPYDEISDEHLQSNRNSSPTPRVHPYDDVADETLEANRSNLKQKGQGESQQGRRHNYDDVDLERTMSKLEKDSSSTSQ